ncbi:hypothetical protein Scep_000555 [Stephania cephalantha]|uniref:Uncharacterized protein n=1 Tax=Stephania cephalantha TaxID=152367 RepID=A0AAP0LA25_9MAGN
MAFALANVALNKGMVVSAEKQKRTAVISSVLGKAHLGRRGFLLSVSLASSVSSTSQNDSKTALMQKYLKKSEENKAKNDKERLQDYYKRNYKDYFEFIEGSIKAKKELSESEKGILDWLQSNK